MIIVKQVFNPLLTFIKDMAKAKARLNDPALKKLIADAGVEDIPEIVFYTTAE